MQPNERRRCIMDRLSFRRQDTIKHLAVEFGVSWNTIFRDLQILSEDYPIITIREKKGGVSLPAGYYISRKYLTKQQAEAIRRNLSLVDDNDRKIFESILTDFALPK